MKVSRPNSAQSALINGQQPWVKLERFGALELAKLIGESPRAARLLTQMVAVMDSSNALVATHEVLAEIAGMTQATVRRALPELEERNLLEIVRIQQRGSAHLYKISDRVAWSGRAGNRYGVARARVITKQGYQDRPDLVGQLGSLTAIATDELGSMLPRPHLEEDDAGAADQLDMGDRWGGD